MSEELAIPQEDADLFLAGLEDFDEAEDGTIPRVSIDHLEAKFVDSLSQEQFNPLRVILLGLKKQRVLWPASMDEEPEAPYCKAVTPKAGGAPGEEFPWIESGFDATEHEDGDLLPCGSCRLKDWGSHPVNDTPWCTEQYVFPALLTVPDENLPPEDQTLVPVILTFQRATLTPAKKYMQAFARMKTPTFTAWTEIELSPHKRGTVQYATARFKKMKDADVKAAGLRPISPDDYRPFAESFKQIEGVLKSSPVSQESPVELEAKPKAAATAAVPSVGEMADDDIPFE